MTILEISNTLLDCANYLDNEHARIERLYPVVTDTVYKKWATAIRSIAIPEPLNETMKEHEKIEQHITCSACGLIARIKYGSMEDVRPVSLRCSCGAITPYENQKD